MDEQESNKDENIHLRRFLRVLANVLIICCLCGSGYLIYFVVKRSQTFSKMQNAGWYERNEVRELCFQISAVTVCLGHQHNHCYSLRTASKAEGTPNQGPKAPVSTFVLILARKRIGLTESFQGKLTPAESGKYSYNKSQWKSTSPQRLQHRPRSEEATSSCISMLANSVVPESSLGVRNIHHQT